MAELLYNEVPTWLPSYANEFTAVVVKSESFDITATSNYMTQARFDSISTRFRIDNKVRVYRGSQGFLISRKGVYGLVLFQITEFAVILPVPMKFLDIGAKFRPLAEKIADEFPTVVETQSAKMEAGNLPIEIFIRSLWVALRGQQDKLRQLGLSESSMREMFGPQFFSNVDSITRAMSNQVRHVLGSGGFSIQDLAGLPKGTSQWPRAGSWTIYMRLYTKLDPGHVDINNAGIYIGQTRRQIRHRDLMHESDTKSSHRPHYRTARRGLPQDRYMLPLLIWAPEDIAALRPIVLEMAEQTMILLFQCYHPLIHTAPRGDMVTMDGVWLEQKRQGLFMHAAARDACAATGWKRYPDVNFIGLNFASPVFGWQSAPVVTCVFTKSPEPTFRNFYTYQMPRRVNKVLDFGHEVALVYYDGSGTRCHITFSLYDDAFQGRVPEVGYLVLELMEDGNPHPQPYMGFPIVGPFENFGMPSSLGIKFVWLDEETSQWKTVPIARKNLPRAHEGWVELWKKTMSLIALFHGVEWQGPTHGIQRWSFGGTQVKELQINHLKQTCEWIPRGCKKAAAPKRAKWVDNCHILTNYLAQFPQTVVNPTDGPIGYAHGYWNMTPLDAARMPHVSKPNAPCDLCVVSQSSHSSYPCDREASFTDGWVCKSCFKLNRPCTFTPPSLSQQLWGKNPPFLRPPAQSDYGWSRYPSGEFRRIAFHCPISPEELNTSKDTVEPLGGKLGLWSMEDNTSDESEPTEE